MSVYLNVKEAKLYIHIHKMKNFHIYSAIGGGGTEGYTKNSPQNEYGFPIRFYLSSVQVI